jgi:hypothetical protein
MVSIDAMRVVTPAYPRRSGLVAGAELKMKQSWFLPPPRPDSGSVLGAYPVSHSAAPCRVGTVACICNELTQERPSLLPLSSPRLRRLHLPVRSSSLFLAARQPPSWCLSAPFLTLCYLNMGCPCLLAGSFWQLQATEKWHPLKRFCVIQVDFRRSSAN